jgi:hypothetical protein
MRKTLVIIVLLGPAAVPMFGQWHWSARISETDSASLTSRSGGWGIGVNEADVHIVWFDKTFSSSTVRYGSFPIGGSTAPPLGVAINSDYGCEPVLSISDTNAHVDWGSGSLYFREVAGMGMSPILEHGWPGTSNFCPAIADDASGNTHCIFNYSDESRGYCLAYQRREAGGAFSTPVEIIGSSDGSYGDAYYPTICVDPDGNIHAAWIQSWKGNIGIGYGTSADGSNWTVSEIPNSSCDPYGAPSICCTKLIVYVAYVSTNGAIHVRDRFGTTWSGIMNVSGPDMICGGPSVCTYTIGPFSIPWVAWHGRVSKDASNEIYYSSGFSDPEQLTSSDSYESQYPNIAADPNGNVHIIWSDSCDGNFEIYYNWRGGVRQGRDLAVTCIRQPVGRISKDSIFPLVRIGNFGEARDSCYANCKITGPGSNYNKNNWFGPRIILPGQEVKTPFQHWTPPGNVGDVYEVKVTVYILPDSNIYDDDPGNNVFVDSCVIRGVAVTATTILEPQEGDTLEHLTPAAYFTNTGTEPAANFYCHCDITSAGFHGDDYADSVLVAGSLAVGDSIFVGFDDYGCEENCSYVAVFHATSATEDTIYSPHIQVHFHGPYTGVAEPAEVLRIELAGTNPFGAPPWIDYSIGVPTEVSIRVYDVTGKLVKILHDGELSGRGRLDWNEKDQEGRTLASGLYFVRILTPQFDRTHKIVLVR